MRRAPVVLSALLLASCSSRQPAPVEEPAVEEEAEPETEIEMEPQPQLDEASKALQLVGKGSFVIVESGFSSFEGDRCVITLDADGNLVTSVSLHSGHSCPYEQGQWKVDPRKVQELVQMLNSGSGASPPGAGALSPSKGTHSGTTVQTGQGAYEVVPPGKVDPVGDYLFDLYESQ